MNFYDKIHELVKSLKETEEYKNYMDLKSKVKENVELSENIKEFRDKQRTEQMKYISGTEIDEQTKQDMQQAYSLLIQNPLAIEFFQAEVKLDVILADMQKIIGESLQDVVEF